MWYFRRKAPDEKIRNPIQGEFFATEAIEGPGEALVRESVQNSLDAGIKNSGVPVSVRITLATGDQALPAAAVAGLFEQAWPHYDAEGNGLRNAPSRSSACPYVLIEDFGTKGLTGDPAQSDPHPDPNQRNPFFLFFRAEGLSAKSGTDLGRWGVGKFVFPRSSLASTHFGLTVRHDDRRRLLLGAVTLKAHRIRGEDSMYSPDGLYGKAGSEAVVFPIDAADNINAFCKLFGLARTDEPGLSVVVPFVDAEEITYEKLLFAAAKGYFLPILGGRLEITVTAGARTARLAADTNESVVRDNASLFKEDLNATLMLARAALQTRDEARVVLGPPDAARAHWSEDMISEELLTGLQARLAGKEPVAVRVPVTVRPKKEDPLPSWFDIYLVRDSTSDGRPTFVREGIIVSDVRGKRARDLRSLVIIDDKPLATLLGDSENPAHTQWQKDGSNFKGRYVYGPSVISFVSESVGELIAILNRRNEEADATLTVDYFSITPPEDDAAETEEAERRRPKSGGGDRTADEEIQVTPRPTRIRIARDEAGFSILPGSQPPQAPYLIEVRCAYDLRVGNPLKQWYPADFALGSADLPVTCDGEARLLKLKENWALLRIDGPAFHARFQGFDVNRDVYVRADVREPGDASSET